MSDSSSRSSNRASDSSIEVSRKDCVRKVPSHIGKYDLELSDEQAAALERELRNIVENDRYPFSPRIRTLREILNMIRPEPVREPLPPRKHYEPPRATAKRRR
jgi:hypothetical protein